MGKVGSKKRKRYVVVQVSIMNQVFGMARYGRVLGNVIGCFIIIRVGRGNL